MSFSNVDIYNTCKYLLNKSSFSGYVRIDDFNLLLKQANILALKERLGLSNDYGILQPLSRKQRGVSLISDDEIRQFKTKATVSFSSGVGSLPANYFKYDSISVDGSLEPCEVLNSAEVAKRLSNPIDAPDALFPIAEISGSSLYMYPVTVPSCKLTYYRYPVDPRVSYYVSADGEVVPMAAGETHLLSTGEIGIAGQAAGTTVTSTTVEHEWSSECAIDLVYIILKNMGINLGRNDVFSVADKIQKEGV